MIIDNKGRLFGKVNIIDIAVALVVIAAVFFVATKMSSPTAKTSSGEQDYIMKFYAEEASDFVIDALQIGDTVEDEQKGIYLGTITNLVPGTGYMFVPDAEGNLHQAAKEGYKSCEITTELQAQTFQNGVIIDGNKYGVGHSFTIRAGKSKLFLKISAIELKGAE